MFRISLIEMDVDSDFLVLFSLIHVQFPGIIYFLPHGTSIKRDYTLLGQSRLRTPETLSLSNECKHKQLFLSH